MKIRNGFVSNSSSSSFVLIAPRNEFEEWKNQLDGAQRQYVEVIGFEDENVLGMRVCMLSREISSEDTISFNSSFYRDLINLNANPKPCHSHSSNDFYVYEREIFNTLSFPKNWFFKTEYH